MEVKDSNGTVLADGGSVLTIKDLKVKGTSVTLKRGTLIKISALLRMKTKLSAEPKR